MTALEAVTGNSQIGVGYNTGACARRGACLADAVATGGEPLCLEGGREGGRCWFRQSKQFRVPVLVGGLGGAA